MSIGGGGSRFTIEDASWEPVTGKGKHIEY